MLVAMLRHLVIFTMSLNDVGNIDKRSKILPIDLAWSVPVIRVTAESIPVAM